MLSRLAGMEAAGIDSRVVDAVARRGGVARTATLQREGHSRHAIARALTAGLLHRPRRGWVALRSADPELRAAARWGVVLTCVTQARRLGLWVLREEAAHVAAPAHSGAATPPAAVVHRARPIMPRHPDQLEDSIENVLAVVATCQPHDTALAVWESALARSVTSRELLARLPLRGRAASLRSEAMSFLGSGLESIFLTRLRWLRVRIVPQAWLFGHRVDFLIGDRLVVQIDGAHHVGPQRSQDIAHDAALALRGFHVLRFSYEQVIDDWPGVQDVVVGAVARGLHRRPA